MTDRFGQELKRGDPVIYSVSSVLKVAIIGRLDDLLHIDGGQWYHRVPGNVAKWFPPQELVVGASVIFGQGTTLMCGMLVSKMVSTWHISVGPNSFRREVEEIRRYE